MIDLENDLKNVKKKFQFISEKEAEEEEKQYGLEERI